MPRKATEKHDVKATVYLTTATYQAALDLARLRRCSWPEYVENLIERDIEASRDKLSKFKELCENF